MRKTAEQRLREYLYKKYGDPYNILDREKAKGNVQVPDVWHSDKKK